MRRMDDVDAGCCTVAKYLTVSKDLAGRSDDHPPRMCTAASRRVLLQATTEGPPRTDWSASSPRTTMSNHEMPCSKKRDHSSDMGGQKIRPQARCPSTDHPQATVVHLGGFDRSWRRWAARQVSRRSAIEREWIIATNSSSSLLTDRLTAVYSYNTQKLHRRAHDGPPTSSADRAISWMMGHRMEIVGDRQRRPLPASDTPVTRIHTYNRQWHIRYRACPATTV